MSIQPIGSFPHSMKMYNALYCNRTYREAVAGAGAQLVFCQELRGMKDHHFGSYLTDAALECCGHPFCQNAVSVVFTLAETLGGFLPQLVYNHLANFATIEHIDDLRLQGEADCHANSRL